LEGDESTSIGLMDMFRKPETEALPESSYLHRTPVLIAENSQATL
jgi:hypothetical protein